MNFKVETINTPEQITDDCDRCEQELDELYWRNEHSKNCPPFDLVVLKCPQCKAVRAYFIDDSNDSYMGNEWDDTSPMNDHSYPRMKNPKKALPRKCASVYSKAVSTQENKNKELNKLIQNKLQELYKIGLSIATVNFAKSMICRYIKANTTTKQLNTLLAAAIYAKANSVTTDGGLWKHKGEGATERQLEEIFGVSRKTIRKWADKLQKIL